ncbi:hypothetical protein, partial [Sphingomonas sp. S-NIH.Pt1_0416]|uniref:hypothetical protein n=1 Tax=Sphingomonas sp. S-NIH.Pt1_0416 TaxID=1920123 RepID=UPI0019D28292
QPTSVMLATSGFGPAHVLSKVFAKPGESQLTEIAQPNFRSGSEAMSDRAPCDCARIGIHMAEAPGSAGNVLMVENRLPSYAENDRSPRTGGSSHHDLLWR